MPWLFLLVSIVGACLTFNSYSPIYRSARAATLSFFGGWLTGELALHQIAWQLVATAVFIHFGALQAWPGRLGLVISSCSWAALGYGYWSARGTEAVVERALIAALGKEYRDTILPIIRKKFVPAVDWRGILLPFPMRHPDVERIRDIPYADVGGWESKLDIYRHRSRPTGCPILLQIHGGGWVLGSKNEQGIPLMRTLPPAAGYASAPTTA